MLPNSLESIAEESAFHDDLSPFCPVEGKKSMEYAQLHSPSHIIVMRLIGMDVRSICCIVPASEVPSGITAHFRNKGNLYLHGTRNS